MINKSVKDRFIRFFTVEKKPTNGGSIQPIISNYEEHSHSFCCGSGSLRGELSPRQTILRGHFALSAQSGADVPGRKNDVCCDVSGAYAPATRWHGGALQRGAVVFIGGLGLATVDWDFLAGRFVFTSFLLGKKGVFFVADSIHTTLFSTLHVNAETFSGLWYLHEPFAQRMEGIILPRLAAGFDPIPPHFMGEAGRLRAAISTQGADGNWDINRSYLRDFLQDGGGDVAVIPVDGTMSRSGFCGYGNERIASILEAADGEPQVKAVVMKFNTPGGTVDSTDMLADAVRNFSKPIVAWTNYCASAGYFVASQCDQIVIENSISSEMGSIGVLMVYVDQSAALEKMGLKVTIYRAKGSEDKARINGVEPLTAELEAEIQTDLNVALKSFHGYVRRGRAGKLTSDEALTGKMYKKKQALSLGLADRMGSLGDAVKLARGL